MFLVKINLSLLVYGNYVRKKQLYTCLKPNRQFYTKFKFLEKTIKIFVYNYIFINLKSYRIGERS